MVDQKKVVKTINHHFSGQHLASLCQAPTEANARSKLERFAASWDGKYPQISKSWQRHWPNLITLFDYPGEIRKAIYITNAIESLNSVIRHTTRKRKIFPHDDSALEVVYLAIQAASARWTIRELIEHKAIQQYANGRQYTNKTLHNWVNEVYPRTTKEKIGRPSKKVPRNMLGRVQQLAPNFCL